MKTFRVLFPESKIEQIALDLLLSGKGYNQREKTPLEQR